MSMYDGYSKAGLIFGNSGGGDGGTTNYTQLTNKPKINGTTIVGDLDADALGLTNSYAYKLVRDGDNNRNYFIDGAGEEIDTADVYNSMIDMALASNALGIINFTLAGFENVNLARLYYTSIDIESDTQGFLFSARENNVPICAKVEPHNVEVVIRDVYFIVTCIVNTSNEVTDLSATYQEIMDAYEAGSNVKIRAYVQNEDAVYELNNLAYVANNNISFNCVNNGLEYLIIIWSDGAEFINNIIQNKYNLTTITLLSNAWTNNTQTVSVEGMTNDVLVQVSPVPSDVDAYANAKIVCTAQGEGTLTFNCGSAPTSNLTVTVINWG